MWILLAEAATLSMCILSGGILFKEKLQHWPSAKLLVGGLAILSTLLLLFELYGSGAKHIQKFRDSMAEQAKLDNDKQDKADDSALHRELQSDLKRLGCYRGGIDGHWGEQSKQALTDFLASIGTAEKYGNSIKVAELRTLLRSAPNGVCRPVNPTNQMSPLKRYETAHNAYLAECVTYFLAFRLESYTGACKALKLERDNLLAKLSPVSGATVK